MANLSVERYLTAMPEQVSQFAALIRGADPNTHVPTCPDWDLAQLVTHVGGTQDWIRLLVEKRITDPERAFEQDPPVPDRPADWPSWLTEGSSKLVAALRDGGLDTPVWNPSGGGHDSGRFFWLTRLFAEAAVHRADAAIALRQPYELAPDLASEAITDWLCTMTSPAYWQARPDVKEALRGDGQTLHWHATDEPSLGELGEWFARRTPEGPVLEREHGKADVAVRGPAQDLLLVISRRLPLSEAEHVDVIGDRPLLEHWIDYMDWIGG